MKRCWLPFGLGVCAVLLAAPCYCDEPIDRSLLDQFLRAVPKTTSLVNQVVIDVRCRVTEEHIAYDDASIAEARSHNVELNVPKLTGTYRVAFRNGMGLREGNLKTGDEVLVKNDAYAFLLRRSDKAKSRALEYIEQCGGGIKCNPRIMELEAGARFSVFCGWQLFSSLSVDKLVNSPDFHVKSVKPVVFDGRNCVRIEFEHLIDDANRRKERFSDAYLVCDPAQSWILRGYGATLFHGGIGQITIDYGDVVNGFPIPRTITNLYSAPKISKGARRSVTSLEITSKDVPKEEFYLSHYGLPEPRFPSRWFARSFWYAVAGLVCVAVAVLIRSRLKRV